MNSAYARKTGFRERIAHGMLSASLISTVLGTRLPGQGAIYLGQEIRFIAPVRFGDTITAMVEVQRLIPEKNRAVLRTYCINQDGEIVLDGEAVVMPPLEKD